MNELTDLKTKSQTDPTELRTDNGKIAKNSLEITEELNTYFVNIGPKMAKLIEPTDASRSPTYSLKLQPKCKSSFFLMPCTASEISNIIDSLKTNNASRSIDDKAKFFEIRKILWFIAQILSSKNNACILLGVFPSCLKVAEIVPFYKKDHPTKATNYRPIS